MADEAETEAKAAELQASVLRHQAAQLRKLADAHEGLTIAVDSDTTDLMDTSLVSHPGARKSQGHMTKKHRQHLFVQALAREGLTVGAVAKALGYSRTTIQSWYRTGDGAREIPRAAAEAIRDRWKVPLSAWTRIEKP